VCVVLHALGPINLTPCDRLRRIQEQVLGKLDPCGHNPQTHHRRRERIRCAAPDPFSECEWTRLTCYFDLNSLEVAASWP